MSTFDAFFKKFREYGLEAFGRYYGMYPAEVKEVLADGLVRLIAMNISEERLPPAIMVTPFGGAAHGMFLPPDVGDIVVVMFQDGDAERPMYVGGWYGKGNVPADFVLESGQYQVKGLVTKDGLKILLDSRDSKSLRIVHPTAEVALTENAIVVSNSDGGKVIVRGKTVTVVGDLIELGEGATEQGVKGNRLDTYLTSKLTVSTPMGPSGPATIGLSPDELSSVVKLK